MIRGIVKTEEQAIAKKCSSLEGHMAKNPTWPGCLGRVGTTSMHMLDTIIDVQVDEGYIQDDEGAGMFLA